MSGGKVPKFWELMWPAIEVLRKNGGSASNDEILEGVIAFLDIPEHVQNIVHTDGRQSRVGYNLAWAKTYLKKVGAVDNSERGVWSLTEEGERLTPADVQAIPRAVRRADAEHRAPATTLAGGVDAADADTQGQPEQDTSELLVEDGAWKTALLKMLISMKPDAFERLCQRLLRESGFTRVEVTGRSGDGGIDGVGVLRVALLSFQVSFQCKKYAGSVSSSAIRDFRGAMVGRSDKGLVITTGTFTADAKREATRDGAPAIDLIDGTDLCNLLQQTKLGVETKLVEQVMLHKSFFKGI